MEEEERGEGAYHTSSSRWRHESLIGDGVREAGSYSQLRESRWQQWQGMIEAEA